MTVRAVYDLFHGDPLASSTFAGDTSLFKKAYVAGWIGYIEKLTQGAGYVDPLAVGRLRAATAVSGILLGGYHYMTLTDTVSAQVANFMFAVGRVDHPLMLVLDFETTPSRVAEGMASEFVNAIRIKTGHWPVLYTGRWTITPIPMDNLPACDLWLPEYGTHPIPPPGFSSWKLHQYSDGTAGPNPVDIPGIGKVDQSEFNGTIDELRVWWPS